MKFLTASILPPLLAATSAASDCMKPPFKCHGTSLLTNIVLVTLFIATASATECNVPVLCTRGVGKSQLIANIPSFRDFGDSYSSVGCAQVNCSRTCRRSLEACRVLCGGNEDLPRCAIGVSPPPPGPHGTPLLPGRKPAPHTIPADYSTAHLNKNNTHPPIRVTRSSTRLPCLLHRRAIPSPYCAPFDRTEICSPPWNWSKQSGGPRSRLCEDKCNADKDMPLCPPSVFPTYTPSESPSSLHYQNACAPVGVDCWKVCAYGMSGWDDGKCFFDCDRELAHPSCKDEDEDKEDKENTPTIDRPTIYKPTDEE